jgi:hypothetical protein
MSKMPGGYTARINCMIIAGFPGIGKTSTWKQMKLDFAGARAVDMDVKNYGTTNGINVADPAAYANEVEQKSHDNACIFVCTDPDVLSKLREAHLFYIVVAPEFPPSMASQIPYYRPNPLERAQYMKRFTDNIGYNSLAAQTLDGKGYEDALIDLFRDPMPHIVSPVLNKQVVDQSWAIVEQMTRQTISPNQLMGMRQQTPTPMNLG